MTTPTDEKSEQQYRLQNDLPEHPRPSIQENISEEEGTAAGESSKQIHSTGRGRSNTHLTLDVPKESEFRRSLQSPGQSREQAHRLDDDLAMLHVEQQVSQSQESAKEPSHSRSMHRSRSRREEPVDDFDEATNPLHQKVTVYRPPENPNTKIGKIFKKIHSSSILVRWFLYITPPALIILIPLLLGALLFKNATVGDVKLDWFCIWLEIVWLSLWAGRVSLLFLLSLSIPLIKSRSLPNVYHGQSASCQASSRITARNGGIWVSSLSCRQHYFSGGLLLRYPFFRP
jgi:hypothetical protein